MKKLEQKRTSHQQVFPFPVEGEIVWETPPCFVWIADKKCSVYTVVVCNTEGEIWRGQTEKNYMVPTVVIRPGKYKWNLYALVDGEEYERGWIEFTIAKEAIEFLRPTGRQIYNAVPMCIRPRHLFEKKDVPKLLQNHTADVETLKRNIEQAYADGLPEEPHFYSDPTAVPYREYFGRHRDFVDRNLISCALGYQLFDDIKAGVHAKKILLTICSWDPDAESSLLEGQGDELGLSHARCLPAAFDMLYELLDEEERALVINRVAAYAQQCEDRLRQTDFVANPGNSHVGRLPAYLGEAAMVLKGVTNKAEADRSVVTHLTRYDRFITEETLIRWLDLAAEIFGGIFPFYGGPDGSWGEGPFYATSYTKWYLPFFNAVDRYLGVSYLKRPFYQRLTHFLMHFADPKAENHPFGDGYWCRSEDEEWPGFFAQNPFRIYAEKYGPDEAIQMEKMVAQPNLFKLHLLDIFLPVREADKEHITGKAEKAQSFPYAGLVSLRSQLVPEVEGASGIAAMARASRYGSASHSHPDQGSFALFYNGIALITPSGYFGRAYGSQHHQWWTNTTQAHNCILVNGEGQKRESHEAVGKILTCTEKDGVYTAAMDLTGAYPGLQKYIRCLIMNEKECTLSVQDDVYAKEPVQIDWLLHSLSLPVSDEKGQIKIERKGVRLEVQPKTGLDVHAVISDQFGVDINEGEPEAYRVTMPKQYHMAWRTPQAKSEHHIQVELKVAELQ